MPKTKPHLRVPPEAGYAVANSLRVVANVARQRQTVPDYVVFTIQGSYPDLPPQRNFWQQRFLPPVVSLQDLADAFRTVAGDGRVRGVVLHLRPLALSLAQLQTLRGLIQSLRQAGKHVVVWSHSLSTGNYFVAAVADEILLQPGAIVAPLGLRRQYAFLADALDRVGLRFDVVQISPYKSAGDMLSRTEMSEAAREMANWLADADYGELIRGIAEGRGTGEAAARELVDGSPYTDLQALDAGIVDGLIGEEDLPARLGEPDKPARLATWDEVHRRLVAPRLPRGGRHVALIRIEGMIVDGTSEQPPLPSPLPIPLAGEARAGDLTVVQDARAALADDAVAAVVVYIDSPGGSATASEAMAAALAQLAAKKPLVAVMGSVAASGGYYVATPAHHIIAQPGTLTGSIGVVMGKFVNSGLLDRLRFHRETILRGQNADFETGERPFSPEERAQVWEQIRRIYDVFVDRVAVSRHSSAAEIDAVGGGRVWTGRQAQERGLVDSLGGLEEGLAKARELAGLNPRTATQTVHIGKHRRAPLPSTAAALAYVADGARHLNRAGALCLCPLVGWEDGGDGSTL